MRKILSIFMVATAGLVATGCETARQDSLTGPQRSSANAWIVESYPIRQTEAAIIRQRTIYPYHFVTGTAYLNDLGRRDVTVLARHFKDHPGSASIRHPGQDAGLLEARVDAIKSVMAQAGVTINLVTNGPTGGDGMASENVLVVLSEEDPVWQPYKD